MSDWCDQFNGLAPPTKRRGRRRQRLAIVRHHAIMPEWNNQSTIGAENELWWTKWKWIYYLAIRVSETQRYGYRKHRKFEVWSFLAFDVEGPKSWKKLKSFNNYSHAAAVDFGECTLTEQMLLISSAPMFALQRRDGCRFFSRKAHVLHPYQKRCRDASNHQGWPFRGRNQKDENR